MPATPQQLMMAGPSFGSAVAVSQGAGELELGMSDFLGFGWVGFLGRGTAAPGRCITGGDAPQVGDVPQWATRRGWATHRSGRRTAVGDAPQWATHRVAPTIWSGGVFGGVAPLRRGDAPRGGRRTAVGDAPRWGGDAPRRPYMAMWGWHGGVAPLRPYIPTTHLLQ